MNITLSDHTAQIINDQVSSGSFQSPEDVVSSAIELLLESLMRQEIDKGIDEGLADVKAGRYTEISRDTVGAYAASLFQPSVQ